MTCTAPALERDAAAQEEPAGAGWGREGVTAWTLTGSRQCSQNDIFHCLPSKVQAGLTEHHGHEAIKGAHTAQCNLSEMLLFEFSFKRGKVIEINICLSLLIPALSL